jgi:hypothetical protein
MEAEVSLQNSQQATTSAFPRQMHVRGQGNGSFLLYHTEHISTVFGKNAKIFVLTLAVRIGY